MRRILLSAAAFCAIALCGTAEARTRHAPPPKMTDEQIDKVVGEIFDKGDVNHDDGLSRIELTTYGFSNNLGVAVQSRKWSLIDANHDGSISRDELHAYMKRYDRGR